MANDTVEYFGFKATLAALCQDGIKIGFSNEDIIRALKSQLQLEEQMLDTRFMFERSAL